MPHLSESRPREPTTLVTDAAEIDSASDPQVEIARRFNVNQGRVSEVLKGVRT